MIFKSDICDFVVLCDVIECAREMQFAVCICMHEFSQFGFNVETWLNVRLTRNLKKGTIECRNVGVKCFVGTKYLFSSFKQTYILIVYLYMECRLGHVHDFYAKGYLCVKVSCIEDDLLIHYVFCLRVCQALNSLELIIFHISLYSSLNIIKIYDNYIIYYLSAFFFEHS